METSGSVNNGTGAEWLLWLALIALFFFPQLFWLCHFSNQTGMKKGKFGNSGLG